jgi:hypothetical protein
VVEALQNRRLYAALRPLNRWIKKKMSASRSNKWIIAAATWKTTNAPIHVKNKRNAKARNTNLICMTLWVVMIARLISEKPAHAEAGGPPRHGPSPYKSSG